MKRKKFNFYKVSFYGGLTILIVSVGLLIVDSKTGWLISKRGQVKGATTQAQIRQQRLEAIGKATENHSFAYKFETPGGNFLTMPTSPGEVKK